MLVREAYSVHLSALCEPSQETPLSPSVPFNAVMFEGFQGGPYETRVHKKMREYILFEISMNMNV